MVESREQGSIDWQETVQEFLDRRAAKWAEATVRFYRAEVGLLMEWAIGQKIGLASFRRRHMERYLAERKKTVRLTTTRQDAICARAFFEWCAREGIVASNPLRELELPPREQSYVPVPKQNELVQLLTAIERKHGSEMHAQNHQTKNVRSFIRARDKAIVCLLVETGLRVSEMCRLDLTDLDLDEEAPRLIVRQSKTYKTRRVPLTKALVGVIVNWLKVRNRHDIDCPAVFVTLGAVRLNRDSVHKQIDRYWQFAGIEPKSLHSLRHYALTAIARGADILTAAAVAGHKRIETTAKYLHIGEEQVREGVTSVNTLGGILNGLGNQSSAVPRRIMPRRVK